MAKAYEQQIPLATSVLFLDIGVTAIIYISYRRCRNSLDTIGVSLRQ